MKKSLAVMVVSSAVLAIGCGAEQESCRAGDVRPCSCDDSELEGTQHCVDEGVWGACECLEPAWMCDGFDCEAADAGAEFGFMEAIDGCNFELALEEPLENGQALADDLLQRLEDEGLGSRRTLASVAGELDLVGRAGLGQRAAERLSDLDATGFRWDEHDEEVRDWYTQGITGTSDYSDDGLLDGKRLLLVSWYNKTDERPSRGARITLADITDLGAVSYRHLLLVDPHETEDGPTFGPAEYDGGGALHVGGIAWYGSHLYVADTMRGLRVYDLSRIFSLSHVDEEDLIGVSDGRADAHGLGYAIPRIGRYRLTERSCPFRFSFVGLDRFSDPPILVTGEYRSLSPNARLATWPLDSETHRLETREGTTRATAAVVIGQNRAQGALRIGTHFYVSCSSQDGVDGRLYKNRPGEESTSVPWVHGAEDLYWEHAHDLIWTPAEHPGNRDVAAVPAF